MISPFGCYNNGRLEYVCNGLELMLFHEISVAINAQVMIWQGTACQQHDNIPWLEFVLDHEGIQAEQLSCTGLGLWMGLVQCRSIGHGTSFAQFLGSLLGYHWNLWTTIKEHSTCLRCSFSSYIHVFELNVYCFWVIPHSVYCSFKWVFIVSESSHFIYVIILSLAYYRLNSGHHNFCHTR